MILDRDEKKFRKKDLPVVDESADDLLFRLTNLDFFCNRDVSRVDLLLLLLPLGEEIFFVAALLVAGGGGGGGGMTSRLRGGNGG